MPGTQRQLLPCLLALLLLCGLLPALAKAETVVLADLHTVYELGGDLVYLPDPQDALDPDAALASERWLTSPDDYATIGNTSSYIS